jgi:diaminopimelate epimerase
VFTISMGSFTFDSERIPAVGPARRLIDERLDLDGESLRINCVNVGNPHCVVLGDAISREQTLRLGPVISRHPMFPNGINVQFAAVRDRANIDAEVWERGSGYTLASGSSACAIACVAFARELVEPSLTVHMPGGRLSIAITASREILLTGEARAVAEGTFAPGFLQRLAALV